MFNTHNSSFFNNAFSQSSGRVKRKNLKKASEKKEKPEGEEEEDTWAPMISDLIGHAFSQLITSRVSSLISFCFHGIIVE